MELSGNTDGTSRLYNIEQSGKLKRLQTFLEEIIMLFETIAKVIAERTDRDVSEIKPESTFTELGIDSLDTVELVMSLEDALGIEIELTQKVENVGELVAFIEGIQKG